MDNGQENSRFYYRENKAIMVEKAQPDNESSNIRKKKWWKTLIIIVSSLILFCVLSCLIIWNLPKLQSLWGQLQVRNIGRIIYHNDIGIFAMRPNGKSEKQLFAGEILLMDVSSDNGLIAFVLKDNQKTILTMTVEGKEFSALHSNELNIEDIKWSPNGDYLIFITKNIPDEETKFYTIDPNREILFHLTTLKTKRYWADSKSPGFVWSPDKSTIAFIEYFGKMWVINSDGTDKQLVYTSSVQHTNHPLEICCWINEDKILISDETEEYDRLSIYNIQSNELEILFEHQYAEYESYPSNNPLRACVMSPNGNNVVCEYRPRIKYFDTYYDRYAFYFANQLIVYELEKREINQIDLSINYINRGPIWSPNSEWVIIEEKLININSGNIYKLPYRLDKTDHYFWIE